MQAVAKGALAGSQVSVSLNPMEQPVRTPRCVVAAGTRSDNKMAIRAM